MHAFNARRRSSTPGPGAVARFTLIAVAALWACEGGRTGDAGASGAGDRAEPSRAPQSPGAGTPTGTGVIGVATGATTVLPPLAAVALDYEIGSALFLGLNVATWRDGRLHFPASHPLALARARELDSDAGTVTYHLDTGRRWSDGRLIRARDVVFTYRLLSDTTLALPLSYTTGRLDSVAARDDSTVTFFFEAAYPGMLYDSGVGILPEHVYGPLMHTRWPDVPGVRGSDPDEVVVSGPFLLEAWLPDDRIVLRANPMSPVHPGLERIVIRILPEETTRLAELRSGGLDVARITSFDAAARLADEDRIRLRRIPQRGYDYIAWNPGGHAAFGDVRVRQALSLAIDREGILRALRMSRFARPAFGPYGSLFGELRTPPPDRPPHDTAAARRLLEASGWSDADGDGVRERDGRELRFELAVPAGSDRREAAAQLIAAQLARVGVAAEIRTQEFASLFERVRRRDYEAALLGWQVGLSPDISAFWHDPDSPLNIVGYDGPRARAAMDSAMARATAESAAAYWARAGRLIAGDYPYAFLWFFDQLVGVGPRLAGVDPGVIGFGAGLYEWRLVAR